MQEELKCSNGVKDDDSRKLDEAAAMQNQENLRLAREFEEEISRKRNPDGYEGTSRSSPQQKQEINDSTATNSGFGKQKTER